MRPAHSQALSVILLLSIVAQAPCHAKIVAILIGVGAYDKPAHLPGHIPPLTPLKGPLNDVSRLSETLIKFCGVDPEDILLLSSDSDKPDQHPTYANIAAVFTRVRRR